MIATIDTGDAAEPAPAARKPRSGGPRTPEGKDASRRNALKYGLRAKVVFPDDLAETIADRTASYAETFRPASPYEADLVEQIALATSRLERCAAIELVELGRLADRAGRGWDLDRRAAAEELAGSLSKDPARTVAALRRTAHGADLLIGRWEGLAETLELVGGWDEARRALAFDLLGTPHALRPGSGLLPPDADRATLSALVERQLATLRADRAERLGPLDQAEREHAEAGIPRVDDHPFLWLHRYESSYQRSLSRALAELRRVQAGSEPRPASAPRPAAEPPPAPPEPSTAPSLSSALFSMLAKVRAEVEASTDTDTRPETNEPAAVPTPAPAESRPAGPPPTLNRRARREREKLARQAAKRAARLARAAEPGR